MQNIKQKLIIEYLLSSPDTFALCQSIVDHTYFDPEYRPTVKFIKEYFEQYNTTPNIEQVKAETDLDISVKQISKDQISYTTNEIETFCRRKALEKAILASPKLIDEGNYGKLEESIKEAMMVSLQHNLGLRYFENIEERLQQMCEDNPVQSTGWDDVDECLFGGISRQELLLVSANSGGGKSITLANLAVNFVEQRLNVLYLSLELSEKIVAQRFDTMFTGISRKEWKSHISEIVTKVTMKGENCGIMDIIQMPSGTKANDIKAYLKEYYLHYDTMPDLLIVDYLDKMSPNQKVDASDVWTKDKLVAEQLRDIGVEYNMFIATASQLNRCLDPEALITLKNGDDCKLKDINIGDSLLSYDISTNQYIDVTVLNKSEEYHDEYYEIEFEDGTTITCSKNHIWPTSNGELSIESGLECGCELYVNC